MPKRDEGAALSDFFSVLGDELERLTAHHWAAGFSPGVVDDLLALAEAAHTLDEEIRHAGSCPTEFGAALIEAMAGFYARYNALGARLAAHLKFWPGAAIPTGGVFD